MVDLAWLAAQFPDLSGLAPLGQGGQKVVFTATHTADGPVVLKLIHPNQDPERVRRELLAVQQVKSARVPRVLDVGVIQVPPTVTCTWVREQRVSGSSLRPRIMPAGLPVAQVRHLGLHVLEALAAAETVRIVHRDVKPDNIMCDAHGEHWLLDFGIARHLDLTSVTGTAALSGPGTLGYAPPEQYRNWKADVDSRADLFALGVTMVECLTGAHPFLAGARDAGEVIRRIEHQPLNIAAITGDDNGLLRGFLSTLTQRRLDHRPRSAADALLWMRELCTSRS
jgi:eukaryotic-like serine/threonine-protein kinase